MRRTRCAQREQAGGAISRRVALHALIAGASFRGQSVPPLTSMDWARGASGRRSWQGLSGVIGCHGGHRGPRAARQWAF